MNSNRKVMLPNNKRNNHHTLFITLIITLFVLLIVALSKARSYGSELGFNESEVSGNEEVHEDITEDSEERTSVSSDEAVKEDIQIDEVVLEDNSEEEFNVLKSSSRAIEVHTVESTLKSGWRYSGTPPTLQQHSASNLHYVYLTAGIEYTISINSGGTCSTLGKGSVVTMYSEYTITPETNCYYVKNTSTPFTVTYTTGEPDEPPIDDPDPSGNDPDPSGNDPSGNNPSGGGIELDGDLQTYLINYFGHKDYTVYDSEETFKEKKFFVSRYEYEVLKSLDDIKILLLCNIGILIVILFVGRRKRNAGS